MRSFVVDHSPILSAVGDAILLAACAVQRQSRILNELVFDRGPPPQADTDTALSSSIQSRPLTSHTLL